MANIWPFILTFIYCTLTCEGLDEVTNYQIIIPDFIKKYFGYQEEAFLNFTEIAQLHGYKTEEHTVTTEDGYILSIFRIRSRSCRSYKSVPVILMHGSLMSADSWLDAGPGVGLAYLLADSCYDTWLPNSRGTYYGRKHATLNPDEDAKFWEFSNDEMGAYDAPATIDLILEVTGAEKVNYVGHSQGSILIFILLSEHEAYNDKINLGIALAPGVKNFNSKTAVLRLLLFLVSTLKPVLNFLGIYEEFHRYSLLQVVMEFLCQNESYNGACYGLIGLIDSYHEGSFSNATVRKLYSHLPSGIALQSFDRYYQSTSTGVFAKYDYGTTKNLEVYGANTPPVYDLSKTRIPVRFVVGMSDAISPLVDVEWTSEQISNSLGVYVVENSLWNHFDITYSQHIPKLLYPEIDKYLEKYSQITISDSIACDDRNL